MKLKLLYIFSFLICVLLCVRAESTTVAATNVVLLCGRTIIPNLFPFFVISSFMVQTGFSAAVGACVAPLANRLFRISGQGAAVWIIGILCGYPTGAKTVAELYQSRQLTRNEAQRLLPFCNNAGPLFTVGAVGNSMLGSTTLGMYLYLIHILSSVLTGIVLGLFQPYPQKNAPVPLRAIPLGTAFSHAVQSAVSTTLHVCGYLILFSVLCALVPLQSDSIYMYLMLPAEVTLSIGTLAASALPFFTKIVIISILISFGGICVLLQVWGFLAPAGLNLKSYLLGKLLQAVLAGGLAMLFFSPSAKLRNDILLCFLCVTVFVFFLAKLTKNARKDIIRKEQSKKGANML